MGERASWVLAQRFGSIEKLSKASVGELTAVKEIGPVMAESINNFFSNKDNAKILKKLSSRGVNAKASATVERGGKLDGKNIVITGSLKDFSRNEAEELVRKSGGNPSSSVSKETDFLVAGEDPGSKLDRAKTLGVKIIDEEEFKKLVR